MTATIRSTTNRRYVLSKQVNTEAQHAIRIDDPNPDIEFVETDQVAPAGKYRSVQADKLQINGRNAANDDFDTIVVFQRPAAGGNMVSDSRKPKTLKSLPRTGASRLLMCPRPPRRRISLALGFCTCRMGRSEYRGANGTVTVVAPA